MMLATKFWSLRQNFGVSNGGGVPRDALEGGGIVGFFNLPPPSQCLMLPCWCRVSETQRSGELTPLLGTAHYFTPPLLLFTLFPCCPNVVQ